MKESTKESIKDEVPQVKLEGVEKKQETKGKSVVAKKTLIASKKVKVAKKVAKKKS